MAMRTPSPAILGAILLHAGVAALFLVRWPQSEERIAMASSVPVSIVSSVPVAAAAADNPSEELVAEDAPTAPVESPPEPTPPQPQPTPPPPTPRPTPTPTPRPTPPRPTPPRPTPTPPRPAPPRPAPTQPQPSLDLDALAGPRRPAPPSPSPRPATGQSGRGQAAQAAGPQLVASFVRVYSFWNPPCQTPGVADMRIQMDVNLTPSGRLAGSPRLVSPQSGAVWQAVAAGAVQATIAAQPFDVPPGFEGGSYRMNFNTERACRYRGVN